MKYFIIAIVALLVLGGVWAIFFRGEEGVVLSSGQYQEVIADTFSDPVAKSLEDPVANIGYQNPVSAEVLNPFNQ
ncbi:MAG: hypothetical protein HQ488_03975 [Parcubacteria group bacterium]|nr:hypothetical protein [Parcubacteria group bacterium]